MDDTDDVTMEPEDGEGNAQNAAQKLAEMREKLKETQKQRDEYLDSLQRMKADYINAKKRFEEDGKALAKYASEGVVVELLPIADSLEYALSTLPADSNLGKGIENTNNQLLKLLEANGVVSFNPLGEAFDPNLHEPVETLAVESESEDNTVTKVHQKGYTLNGRLIRPARVQVGHYQK